MTRVDKELMIGRSVLSLFVGGAMLAGYLAFSESSVDTADIPQVDESVDFELILPESELQEDKDQKKKVDIQKVLENETKKKSIFDPSTYLQQKNAQIEQEKLPELIEPAIEVIDQDRSENMPEVIIEKPIPKILPESVQLDLTFWPQAPYADRNQPRQDACEEASIILPAYRLNNKPLSREKFTQEIRNLVSLQNELFGSYVDTTVAQTKQLYDIYYGIGTTTILDNPTSDQLREELAAGRPIVAPFAGKMLKNPHYSNGGPRYHMMTLVGYDADHFIVHDVGTKHGAFFRYRTEVIMDALHDFVPISEGSIIDGARRVLVFSRDAT